MKKLMCVFILLLSVTASLSSPINSTSIESSPSSEEELTTTEGSGSSEEESTTTTTTKRPARLDCLGECPSDALGQSIYLPHERCDRFCQCSYGLAFVLACPDPLHFNARLNVCDWPLAAQCSGEGGIAVIVPPIISNLEAL